VSGRWPARPRGARRLALPLGLLLVAAACGAAGAEPPDDTAAVAATAAPAARPGPAATPSGDPPSGDPPALAVVRGEPVAGRVGPGGQPFEVAVRGADQRGHDRIIGRRTFQVSLRGGPTTSYPCESCHQPGRPAVTPERAEDAHRYVLPRHPEESGTRCITCHAPDDVASLALASGERVGMDHGYRLCGQCHYAQVDAWAAGAHGKRLDGWRGRRVLMGCADCHDPHQPGLEPRTPYPGPRLPGGRQ
jgi:hypothetical protein